MKSNLANSRSYSQEINLNSLDDSRQLVNYLKRSSSDQLLIYAGDGGRVSLVAPEGDTRIEFADSSRKLIEKRLNSLSNSSPLGSLMINIRSQATKSKASETHLVIERGKLLKIIEESRRDTLEFADEYKGSAAQDSLKVDLSSSKKYLTDLLKYPPRVMDTPHIDTVGERWAESCLKRYWKQAHSPSQEEQQHLQLLLLAEPEATLVEAFVEYAKQNFKALPDDGVLHDLARALVSRFKSRLSTASYDEPAGVLRLGQRELIPVGTAAQGAFGRVQVFEDPEDSAFTVAAKFPIDIEFRPNALEETRTELAGQMLANREPHENVVGIRGAIRNEDALVLLVEDCSGGTLSEIRSGVTAARANGQIDDKTAGQLILTLAKDMLSGLNHLHTVAGAIHGDTKLQNVFLGIDGRAKVGDFDKTMPGKSGAISMQNLPQALQFLSPEIVRELSDYFDALDAAGQTANGETAKAEVRKNASAHLSQASDCFAAGIALYELCFGVNPIDRMAQKSGRSLEMEDLRLEINDFASLSQRDRFRKLFDGIGILPGLETHREDLERAIFSLMAAMPEYRGTAANTLARPVFSLPGLGSDDVRKTILSISRNMKTPASSKTPSNDADTSSQI